jgi:hypothetical protein
LCEIFCGKYFLHLKAQQLRIQKSSDCLYKITGYLRHLNICLGAIRMLPDEEEGGVLEVFAAVWYSQGIWIPEFQRK